MARIKKTSKESSKYQSSPFKDYWQKHNYFLLYFGLGILVIGYILMAQNPWDNPVSLSFSPIVLLIAYIIIIPLSIIYTITKRN